MRFAAGICIFTRRKDPKRGVPRMATGVDSANASEKRGLKRAQKN